MARIEIQDLPVSLDLTTQEAQEVLGGLNFASQQTATPDFSTKFASNDPNAILIGLLLPAVQKVR